MDIAVVTGSSTGIGFATALRLAREGYKVYATVRSEASGAALMEASENLPISLLVLDVDDDGSVASALGSVIDAEGRIDVLVNNAGVGGGADIEATSLEEFQSIMNTNAWGVLRGIQAVLPTMREQKSGSIVTVTSLAGRTVLPGMGAYAASKWAAEAICESLAMEAAQFGIRVAIVEPGVVATPLFDKAVARPPDVKSPYFGITSRAGRTLLSGLMTHPAAPDEVAEVIYESITTDEPSLRYPVGVDAVSAIAARASMPDDEWVSGISEPDDAQWRTNMSAWFATEIPPL